MVAEATSTRITVSVRVLKSALQFVGGVIAPNASEPILENVLIRVWDDTMTLTASDSGTTPTARIDVDCSGRAVVCVPFKVLYDYVSSLPEQPITITITDRQVALKSQTGKCKLTGDNPMLYPDPKVDEQALHTTFIEPGERAKLVQRIKASQFSISMNIDRAAYLGLIWWDTEICTTDALRMTRITNLPLIGDPDKQYRIHPKVVTVLNEMSRLASPSDRLSISVTDKNILLKMGDYSVLGTLLESQYPLPDYRNLIPDQWNDIWVVNRLELIASLSRVMTLEPVGGFLKLEGAGNKILITGKNTVYEQDGSEEVKATASAGIEIGFQGKLLIESLKNATGEMVDLMLLSPTKGMMIQGDDEQVSILIYPVKL